MAKTKEEKLQKIDRAIELHNELGLAILELDRKTQEAMMSPLGQMAGFLTMLRAGVQGEWIKNMQWEGEE